MPAERLGGLPRPAPDLGLGEPQPPPPAAGYDWDWLARRASARSGEALALLREAMAERHQAEVDAAWRAPQFRLGSGRGELEEETPARAAWSTDPLEPTAAPEPTLLPREWETQESDAYEVGLRVFVANPFVNRWLRAQGETAARAKEAAAQEAADAVFHEVRSLCLEAAALQSELVLLRQIADLRTEERDLRSRQAAAKVGSAPDLIQAISRHAQLRADIREKETEYRGLLRRIAVWANVPEEQIRLRAPADGWRPEVSGWEPETLVGLAMSRRSDLVRLAHEKTAAEHGVRAAKAEQIPWFDHVEGTYEGESAQVDAYEDFQTGFDQTDRDRTEWQLRLAVNLPVFDGSGHKARLFQARADAAAVRLQTLQMDLTSEIARVLTEYRQACAERDRLMEEGGKVQALMTAKIEALAQEAAVSPDELRQTRESVLEYSRVQLRAECECLRLGQYLEALAGGPLEPPR